MDVCALNLFSQKQTIVSNRWFYSLRVFLLYAVVLLSDLTCKCLHLLDIISLRDKNVEEQKRKKAKLSKKLKEQEGLVNANKQVQAQS